MTLDDFLLEAEDKMTKTESVVVNEFVGVRTGKASPALVENIIVEVYGSQMRIRELAGITTPEARTLTIQPWDMNSLHPIEKAIQKSNLGLSPAIQGKAIRLFFPELSEERRQEFVKIIRKMAEDGRVAVLEPNTLPGMTPSTVLFHQAAASGITQADLIDRIIRFALEVHACKRGPL